MPKNPIDRRNFIKLLSTGSAALGLGISAPKVLGKTKNGILVESQDKYGDFPVEIRTNKNFPYEIDPKVLKPMKEKNNCFSRNSWDPERRKALSQLEDLSYKRLIKGEGKVPNQTRLDYALMAAAWTYAGSGDITYRWDGPFGQAGMEGLGGRGPWNPADIDMTWEEASLAVKHAARFYGASLAGIAELNPLWMYSDIYSPTREDRMHITQVLTEGERFEKTPG